MTSEDWVAFASEGRIGFIRPDGTGEHYLELDVPDQISWQLGPAFADGHHVILHSYEEGKSWEGTATSHVWLYDLASGHLEEILTSARLSHYIICSALLPGEHSVIINPLMPLGARKWEQRVYTCALDGSDARAITQPGEGFAYGISLSPEGQRLAFHILGETYAIETYDLVSDTRHTVARHPDHLYFGPVWSPDGTWLAYQDCRFRVDPGHDWADLCIGRPNGSEHRAVTVESRQWFGTSFGNAERRGGGSNSVVWSPDGKALTYTRALPGTRLAWPFQPQRPDTDHFNRDYRPELARGGTQICLLDPFRGGVRELTEAVPHQWDFRPVWSPDGRQITFSRAHTATMPELWIVDTQSGDAHRLTSGSGHHGADFARWLRVETRS